MTPRIMLDWHALGRALRQSALDAHDGILPPVEYAYAFMLDNPECFIGEDQEWPADMPGNPNIELIYAYLLEESL